MSANIDEVIEAARDAVRAWNDLPNWLVEATSDYSGAEYRMSLLERALRKHDVAEWASKTPQSVSELPGWLLSRPDGARAWAARASDGRLVICDCIHLLALEDDDDYRRDLRENPPDVDRVIAATSDRIRARVFSAEDVIEWIAGAVTIDNVPIVRLGKAFLDAGLLRSWLQIPITVSRASEVTVRCGDDDALGAVRFEFATMTLIAMPLRPTESPQEGIPALAVGGDA